MPKNKLVDLNDHLFAQMERLNKEDMSPEEMESEIARTKAMCGLAGTVIDLGRLDLEGWKLRAEFAAPPDRDPLLLEGPRTKDR